MGSSKTNTCTFSSVLSAVDLFTQQQLLQPERVLSISHLTCMKAYDSRDMMRSPTMEWTSGRSWTLMSYKVVRGPSRELPGPGSTAHNRQSYPPMSAQRVTKRKPMEGEKSPNSFCGWLQKNSQKCFRSQKKLPFIRAQVQMWIDSEMELFCVAKPYLHGQRLSGASSIDVFFW